MTITIGKKKKHTAVFVILAFYLLFTPPIAGKHSLYFVAAFSWAYIFWNNRYFTSTIKKNHMGKVYLGLASLLVWSILLITLNNGTRSVVYHYIYWMVAIFPAAISIGIHTRKHNESLDYVLNIILWAALIQSFFSIAAFIDNDVKMILIDKLQADDTLVLDTYTYEIYYRLFGFSAGLTFDMPSAMAIISCIALYMGINKSITYLLFVPTIAFSAMINARTSVVVFGVALVVMLLQKKQTTLRVFIRFSIITVMLILGIIVGILVLKQVSPLTFGWVKSGVGQLIGFLHKETDYGYFGYLSNNDRWLLPADEGVFIGTGMRVMAGNRFGVYSDIGYINDIWFGGLMYTVFLYTLTGILIWAFLKKSHNNANARFLRFFAITYVICLPILNIKTYIIATGAFTTLFIIILVYSTFFKNNDTKSIKYEGVKYE